jgi:hypothetical protein
MVVFVSNVTAPRSVAGIEEQEGVRSDADGRGTLVAVGDRIPQELHHRFS